MELFTCRARSTSLSIHTRTVLTYTAGVYVAATLLFIVLRWPGDFSSVEPWAKALAGASRETINSRSAGFPIDFATDWPRVIQWSTIVLMLIGASPAGAGGGLKVTTLATVVRETSEVLRGRVASRTLGIALVWITVYFLLLGISLLLMLTTEPQMPADRLLFLTTSALGNVGLSHDPVTLSDAGFGVLSATMLAGRIAPILILWWMAESAPDARVAVG